MQVKLLHVLQDRVIRHLGGEKEIKIDVRFMAATNQPLKKMVEEKTFREDLYYRLTEFPVTVPPLRSRSGDIIILANHFLKENCQKYHKNISGFSKDAENTLRTYPWKGNIRELQNVISRSTLLCEDTQLNSSHLLLEHHSKQGALLTAIQENSPLQTVSSLYVKEVYERLGRKKKDTAETLGINYKTLMSRLDE